MKRPRYWWTTVKGGRRSRRRPYKYMLTHAEWIERRNRDA